ncbi:MAG: tetratricopeptide repeat protein, partial [Bradyrhizobium sp.]|nr:tetratricopeptide repeat protein [Bradyrhizobium sp.]
NLGNLYADLDNVSAAAAHYERAIALRATAEAHNNLANVLRKRGDIGQAIAHYEQAVRLKPHYAAALRLLGDALLAQNRAEEACARYRQALASEPEDAITLNHLAAALLVAGRIEDASRAYEHVIEVAPQNLGIQLNYAAVKPFAKDDPRLVRLEEFASREDALSDDQRIALHFTLGKAYADIKDAERSFRHLALGNALKRRYMGYDERETLAHIGRIRDTFSRDLLDTRSDVGHPSDAPLFVVGMPRSGTSLVEQILASHPRVFGAGELNEFAVATEAIARRNASTFPEMLRKISNDDLHELGKTYVESVSKLIGSHDRIVDKMPSNFLFVGLIRLALPRARIIHVKRDPVDTCLSCFSLLFSEGQAFAYDLAELGRYYRAYDTLMGHWREALPSEAMLEVRYEDLVKDLDGPARRLIAFCGLEWDDRCLSFHETKRPVQTASLVQVRKPIYADSVGRWRFYGERLKPLFDALEVDSLPSRVEAETAAALRACPSVEGATAGAWTSLPGIRHPAPLETQVDRAFLLAKRLQERGDLAIAEHLLGFVLGTRPQHFESLLAVGAICAMTNRLDAAKAYLTQAVAVNANVGAAHGSLGAVHASAGELDVAMVHYQKALTLAPDHPGILYASATVLHSLGRNQEAVEQLNRAIARQPDHLDSHFTMGNVLFALGRDGDAARCYLKVLQLSPRHAETHNNLANVLLRQGHAERAIAYYRTAVEIKPDYADAYGNMGNAFLELNRLEESIEQNKRAIEIKPERFGSYNNLGVAYQALGQFEEATWAFERALELSPNEGPIHLNLANMDKFTPDDCRLPGLRRLLDNLDSLDDEKKIAAHFAMGKALADLKQHDDAFEHLKRANELKRKTFDYDEPQRLAMHEN